MSELLRFNWQGFRLAAGVQISAGLAVMMLLTYLTEETWLATALVAMFAWLTNVPGTFTDRARGMITFAVGAIAVTILAGQMELTLWSNVIAISLIGLFGTLAAGWGTRATMVGWVVIGWAIYAPLLVESTSVLNCVLAIVVGTGIVIGLNAFAARRRDEPSEASEVESSEVLGMAFVAPYAMTVGLVLGLTTYYGWVELRTDPTLMAGGAFFVIGFDAKKTWVAGIGRVIGLAAGVGLGLLVAKLLGPGLLLTTIMILAAGASFATMAVHPGAWMFFFMVFVAIGWEGLDAETFDLTIRERFYGESAGAIAAMAAIVFLQWWQNRSSPEAG